MISKDYRGACGMHYNKRNSDGWDKAIKIPFSDATQSPIRFLETSLFPDISSQGRQHAVMRS